MKKVLKKLKHGLITYVFYLHELYVSTVFKLTITIILCNKEFHLEKKLPDGGVNTHWQPEVYLLNIYYTAH